MTRRVTADRARLIRLSRGSIIVAAAGVTHFIHLLEGTDAGGVLGLANWNQFSARFTRPNTPPCTRTQYNHLLAAIPHTWKDVIDAASTMKNQEPTWDVYTLLEHFQLPAGAWVRMEDGVLGKIIVSEGERYVTPVATMTEAGDVKETRGARDINMQEAGTLTQIHMWRESNLPHCVQQAEGLSNPEDKDDPKGEEKGRMWII